MAGEGGFQNVLWDAVESTHAKSWNFIESKYRLISAYENIDELNGPAETLDQIAQRCIALCWDLLFTSAHKSAEFAAGLKMDYLKGWIVDSSASDNPIKYENVLETYSKGNSLFLENVIHNAIIKSSSLYDTLDLPLRDHLITTFAYRFFAENTKPKSKAEYINYLFQCVKKPEPDLYYYSKDARREDQKPYKQKIDRNWKSFEKQIKEIVDQYNSFLQGPDRHISVDDTTLLQAPTWIFSRVLADNYKGNPYRINKKSKIWTILSEPDKNHPNRFLDLAGFFYENRRIPLLIQEYKPPSGDHVRKGYPLNNSMRLEGDLLILPWKCCKEPQHGDTLPESVAAQRQSDLVTLFHSASENMAVPIPPEIRTVIHGYLIERYFHCYALTLIRELRYNHTIDENQINTITLPLKLKAPLLHGPLIWLMHTTPYPGNWISGYIDYWNTTALPVLEELFLWALKRTFSFQELLEAINRSFLEETTTQLTDNAFNQLSYIISNPRGYLRRCDRLNFYRFEKRTSELQTFSDFHENEFCTRLVQYGYIHAAGLSRCEPYGI